MSTKKAIRELAHQQRRYRSQDLYGQRWSNMSIGDYLSRRQAKGSATPQNITQAAPAGWYYAQSDPAGSVRYWNGSSWTAGFKP